MLLLPFLVARPSRRSAGLLLGAAGAAVRHSRTCAELGRPAQSPGKLNPAGFLGADRPRRGAAGRVGAGALRIDGAPGEEQRGVRPPSGYSAIQAKWVTRRVSVAEVADLGRRVSAFSAPFFQADPARSTTLPTMAPAGLPSRSSLSGLGEAGYRGGDVASARFRRASVVTPSPLGAMTRFGTSQRVF